MIGSLETLQLRLLGILIACKYYHVVSFQHQLITHALYKSAGLSRRAIAVAIVEMVGVSGSFYDCLKEANWNWQTKECSRRRNRRTDLL